MWLTKGDRRNVGYAIVDRLPGWPTPDKVWSTRFGTLLIAWQHGGIIGSVVGEQMISVFWAGHYELVSDEAARALLRGAQERAISPDVKQPVHGAAVALRRDDLGVKSNESSDPLEYAPYVGVRAELVRSKKRDHAQ